jgi:hypothetical protein
MNYYDQITRKAILIGCPGPSHNFLKGVRKDLSQMNKFLQSDKGGAWKESEIKELHNPTLSETRNAISTAIADYVMIYFSGHGYTDFTTNHRMLSLADYSIPDWELINESPRQLIIVDACRNYLQTGLSGIVDFGDLVDHFEGGQAYEIFNEFIAHSPEGRVIVHATQPGQYSYDSVYGGAFSQALLHVSTRMDSEADYTPCSIRNILSHIPSVLKKNNNTQLPAITHQQGALSVPFAFSVPSMNRRISTPRASLSGPEILGVAALTVLVVGLVVAASK